ncbi:MAG: histidine phosphatase family protein [Zoogloeaceae bacterium]|nr:histidine phosphatase family protein [Zoogloeaceae bacterium]
MSLASGVTRFCLIRHGETPWNTQQRIQGHTDIGLDEEGVHQADLAARWLASATGQRPTVLYSSDLLRARMTAEKLAERLALPIGFLPEMRERRYGIFEGLTYADARQRYPDDYAAFEQRQPGYAFPAGGESLIDFSSRVGACLQRLAELHAGETVALVTHGGVLDVINRFIRGLPLEVPRDFTIPNTGLNWVVLSAGCWNIESWADIRHLDHGALDELGIV